jgi:ABC-type phosphate transport system substrate-binding protein
MEECGMRKLARLFAGTASVAAAAVLVAGTTVTSASADPIGNNGKPVVPQSYDVVGVGSNTTEFVLDQISVDYNKTVKDHNANNPYFYSWDAVPPGVNTPGNYLITPKAGCSSKTVRPNGSTAGLEALDENEFDGKTGHYCIDFARSSSSRSSKAPKEGPGGVEYVAFAKDAITWATRTKAKGGSDAPQSLDLTQLEGIFKCTTTNWDKVGGKNAAIKVYLPQPGSGTLSTWEKFMGITTPGSCVSQAPEENEGSYQGFNSPNAIFIFSIGSYVAQEYHSAACGKKPTASQNEFGCDNAGYLGLDAIDGVAPLTSAKVPTINPKFPTYYWRTLYNILRWTSETPTHIYERLEPFFDSSHDAVKGYLCNNKTAIADIEDYGFVPTSACGTIS